MNVLAVDDIPANRRLVRAVLEAEGMTVVEAGDGEEALGVLERITPDLVITDVLMPNMDGLTLCMRIRQNPRFNTLPVLVFTSTYNSAADEKLALQAGADRYLSKPAPAAQLIRAVEETCERAAKRSVPDITPVDETVVIKHYNATLIAKLEETNAELMRTNAELRVREESLQAVQQRARLGSWEIDPPTARARWSAQMFALFHRVPADGVPSEEEFFELVHPEDRTGLRAAHEILRRPHGPMTLNTEYRTHPKLGPMRYLSGVVDCVRDETGHPVRLMGTLIDVTERKRAEDAQRESETRTRVLADYSPVGIYMNDPSGALVYANRAVEEILGSSYGEVEGFKWEARLPADERESFPKAWFGYVTSDEDIFDMESRWVRPDGTVRTVHLRSARIRDDGKTQGFAGTAVDITDRLLAEQGLRASEERFRQLAENIAEVFWITDRAKSQIIYISPAFEKVWGRTCESLYTAPRQWIESIHVDDRTRILHAMLQKQAIGMYDEEYRIVRPDGQIRWIRDRAFPVRDASGAVFRIAGLAEDITERKRIDEELQRREERFRLLIENASDIITVLDAEGRISYQSPSTARILGYNLAETAGKNVTELIHPEDVARVQIALRDALKKRGSPMKIEVRFRHSSASDWRIFESVGQCIVDFSGKPLFVINSRDVTESRVLEEQFRQAQKMEAIGTLAGGIAHDFNNILAAIGGYTELAKMALSEDAAIQKHLGAVLKAAVRATDLVRQIMAFSRQQEHQRRSVSLWRVVEEALGLLRATIPATIDFEITLSHETAPVLADPTQVHQVVMNLCTNAWHAMRGRPGRLGVRLENVPLDEAAVATMPGLKAGRYVRLSISDTGCGMDEGTLARIFEPFFTTKAPGEGTGLGLSVVHGIMHSHDGAIFVESALGVGTTFRLYFPALDEPEAQPETAEGETPRGNGERILFVDDEEVLVMLGRQVLEKLGYVVTAEQDPAAALQRVRENPAAFDLVITDLAMPKISGTDLAQQLLQLRPGLPIILTSGYAANLTNERVRDLGMCELLQKPPTVPSLAAAVRRALGPVRPTVPERPRILLVDDDQALRDALRLTLQAKGYVLTEASNGNEALLLYQSNPSDLVITDLVMPEKEGVETIQALKRLNPRVKIIAVSGGGRAGAKPYLQMAKQLGATLTLAKPFSADELLLAVHQALSS